MKTVCSSRRLPQNRELFARGRKHVAPTPSTLTNRHGERECRLGIHSATSPKASGCARMQARIPLLHVVNSEKMWRKGMTNGTGGKGAAVPRGCLAELEMGTCSPAYTMCGRRRSETCRLRARFFAPGQRSEKELVDALERVSCQLMRGMGRESGTGSYRTDA